MKFFLLLVLLCMQGTLFASQDYNRSQTFDESDSVTRIKMLHQAKLLLEEYRMLENKLKSWKLHKRRLIDRFERQNRKLETMHLGHDGSYGKKLAQKRRSDFYASLQKQESRIKKRLFAISQKLSALKEDFYFRYAVELTEDEIYEGKVPRVKEKRQKINLLEEYIRYSQSYQALYAMNRKYDQAEKLQERVAKVNGADLNASDENATKKAEANRMRMYQYRTMAERLREEFYNRYKLQITDLQMARQFLKNLQKSR